MVMVSRRADEPRQCAHHQRLNSRPAGIIFQGDTGRVPTSSNGNLWDIRAFDITASSRRDQHLNLTTGDEAPTALVCPHRNRPARRSRTSCGFPNPPRCCSSAPARRPAGVAEAGAVVHTNKRFDGRGPPARGLRVWELFTPRQYGLLDYVVHRSSVPVGTPSRTATGSAHAGCIPSFGRRLAAEVESTSLDGAPSLGCGSVSQY